MPHFQQSITAQTKEPFIPKDFPHSATAIHIGGTNLPEATEV